MLYHGFLSSATFDTNSLIVHFRQRRLVSCARRFARSLQQNKMDAENNTKEHDIYNDFGDIPEEGETWYLLSVKWMNKWKCFAGIEKNGQERENPGPIDNSGLIDESSSLRLHLMEDIEYKLIPQSAWNALVKIYSIEEGQEPIARKVISTGSFTKTNSIEIYPPTISLTQHEGDGEVKTETFSRATPMKLVHEKMREIFDVPKNLTTRIYIKDSVDAVEESDTLDKAGVGLDQTLVLENQNDDGTWPRTSLSPKPPSYTEATSTSSTTKSKKCSGTDFSFSNHNDYDGSSSKNKNYNGGYWSWSRQEKPGVCGLSNLGNTCFMSSAIQCLSNVPPLTKYFLEKTYLKEINETNPIGTGGELARAYADLIHDMWSGRNSSLSPREFKKSVSSFAPQFSGYQQHDSQELMAFLIDGLHEDLNRIEQKPYIELKESDGRPDYEVAKEAWENHLRRNNSVIVDMFHGLFKSTIVCPKCERVSVTFDPFGFLSLPLPRTKEMPVICNFVPRDPKKPVCKLKVMLRKDGVMRDVCTALGEKMGCKAEHLVITDVYNHRFYKIYRGDERLSSHSSTDNLFVFELGFEGDDEDEEEIEYARVYMRQSGNSSSMRLFAHPFLIPVKSGVTTYRKMYNTILAAVSRYVKQESRDNVKMLAESKDSVMNNGGSDMNGCVDDDTNVDGGDIADNTEEEQPKEEEEIQWFSLVTVNSFGSTILRNLKDDNQPIKFTGEVYFSAEWDVETCDDYAVDDWTKVFKIHPSMSEQAASKRISLQQCMTLFTTREKLGEHDLWYCPSCKDHKPATKKFDLWALPPFLFIHLKRFSYTRWSRDKISTHVNFPTRDLDLSDFVINPAKKEWEPKKKKYNLIGVTNHYGGMGGGHYTAYAFNHKENKWFYFDDTSVSESSEDSVETKAAYMLMYQRQDMEEWVRDGCNGNFNFLESLVSPRNCNAGFPFDVSAGRKRFTNGGDNLMNSEDAEMGIDAPVPMDTS